MTDEQIRLIERIRQSAPDLAKDVTIIINELNRLRQEADCHAAGTRYTGDTRRGEGDD